MRHSLGLAETSSSSALSPILIRRVLFSQGGTANLMFILRRNNEVRASVVSPGISWKSASGPLDRWPVTGANRFLSASQCSLHAVPYSGPWGLGLAALCLSLYCLPELVQAQMLCCSRDFQRCFFPTAHGPLRSLPLVTLLLGDSSGSCGSGSRAVVCSSTWSVPPLACSVALATELEGFHGTLLENPAAVACSG